VKLSLKLPKVDVI